MNDVSDLWMPVRRVLGAVDEAISHQYEPEGDYRWSMVPEARSDMFHTYLQVEMVCGRIGWMGYRDWIFDNATKEYPTVWRSIPVNDNTKRTWYREVIETLGNAAQEFNDYA